LRVSETEPGMGIAIAQFFKIVRVEIDDRDASARAGDTRRFLQSQFGLLREVQHLVKQHGLKAGGGEWQIAKVALDQFNLCGGQMLQLGAGYAQHFQVLVERDDVISLACEQFCHAPGAGADIEQGAQRSAIKLGYQRIFDQLIGDVQLAQFVPLASMTLEIAFCDAFARFADCGQFLAIGLADRCEFGAFALGNGEHACHGVDDRSPAVRGCWGAQEHPAAFAAAFCQAGIAQDPDMARDARLALAEDLRELAHRQLHMVEQAGDAQPGWVCKRAKDRFNNHRSEHIKIFLYV